MNDMTNSCNPHLVLVLVILLLLLLQGCGLLKQLLLLLFFSRKSHHPVSSPIPQLFASDTWDFSDTWDDSDTSDIVDTVSDWFSSLIQGILKILALFFVVFVLVLVGREMILSKQRESCISRRRSVHRSSSSTENFQSEIRPTKIPTSRAPMIRTNNNHVNPIQQRGSISIPHQGFLKSFFVENSRKNGLSGGRDCRLRQWLSNRKALGFGPLMEYKVPRSSATVIYVRDDIKVLIRSLVGFIQDQHDQSYCMNGIHIDDIFVGERSININNLKLVAFSEEIQKKDYQSIGIIIKMVVYEETKHVPYDMEHYVTLFNNPMKYKSLFKVHVALMNFHWFRIIVMSLWEKKKTLGQKLYWKWEKAVNELTDIDDWIKLIDTKSPLYQVYEYGSYEHGNKIDMIRFFRNAAVHLIDYSKGGKMFQLDDSGLIILANFPKTITDFQERLNHHGLLQEFMDENTMN